MTISRGAESTRDEAFAGFVRAASPRLLRVAYLLTADRTAAEDLLQDVLERLYVAWPGVRDADAYVHRSLAHGATSRWRRRARRVEVALDVGHEPTAADHSADGADRDRLVRALRQLPAGQRAVVVLRFFQDQSEAQTAQALGCSPGTVKSQSSRALSRLRVLLADDVVTRSPR